MKHRISPEVRSNFLPRTRRESVQRSCVAPIIAFSIALLCFIAAPAARADSCAPNGTGPFNWNDPAAWTCTPGAPATNSTYPGQNGADTASLCVVSAGATVDVGTAIPSAVTVNMSACLGSGQIRVNAGGSLRIGPSSTINSFNVSGGNLIVDVGGISTAHGAALNGGTLTIDGSLDIASFLGQTPPATFSFNDGTINGVGVLTLMNTSRLWITAGTAPKTISSARIDSLAPVTYTSAFPLQINNAAKLRIIGTTLDMGNTGPITTNAPASSSVEIENGSTMTANVSTQIQAPLNAQAGSTVIANGLLQLSGGGSHWGTFIAQTQTIRFSGTHNFGGSVMFSSPGGSPLFRFDAPGQFNITQNQLSIPGLFWNGGTIGGGQVLDLSATNLFYGAALGIGSGTTIRVSSGTLNLGTTANIAGPGLLQLDPVAVAVNGSPNVISAPVEISSPTFTFGASAQIDFTGGGTINGGTFATTQVTETFRFGGPFLVHAGTFQGPGAFVVPAGGTFTVDGIVGLVRFVGTAGSSRLFLLGGTMVFRDAVTSVDVSGFEIRVDSPGVMELQNDVSLTTSFLPATLFMNGGTLQKTGGAFTSSINPAFTNGGTVIAQSGTLDFVTGYTQTGGRTRLAGGTVAILGGAGSFTLNSGYLEGNGTFRGSVTNSQGGYVSPGSSSPLSTGIITIAGSYSQTGALMIKLGGTAPGTGYDQLNVTGPTATIGGGLSVTYVSPFTSPNGQAYDIFTSTNPRSGTFMSPFTYYPAPAAAWRTNYLPNAAQIVMAQADVSVTKSGPTSVPNGQPAVFIITVTNNDPAVTATNINVSDSATGPAAYSNVTFTGGTLCMAPLIPVPPAPPPPPSVSCSIATLAPGASETITLTLAATGIGTITNTANASGAELDPNPGNNNASVAVTVNPSVDLGIAITDTPDPVLAGADVTYTMTLTNSGLDASTDGDPLNLTLTGGTIVSHSIGFVCTNTATTANCTMNPIPPGSSTSVTLVATAGTGASISLMGSVGDASDTNPENDIASQPTVINAAADLAVSQSASPMTLLNGQSSVVTVTVTNNGPSMATAIPLADTFSGPATVTGATTAAGSCTFTSTTVNCTLSSLGSGASVFVIINLATSAIGTVMSSPSLPTATPPLAQADPTSGNNVAAPLSITVNAASDLSMVITPPSVVNAGQNCSFPITITNTGPDTAASYSASFTLTGGTIVSAGGMVTCTTTATTADCSGSNLASGATATLSIVAAAGISGSIALNGTVSSPSDPNASNNAAGSGAVAISPVADLAVSQSASPMTLLNGQSSVVTVTVTNNGPSMATAIPLADTFSGPATVTGATTAAGSCTFTSTTVNCTLSSLGSGASAFVVINLATSAIGTVTSSPSLPTTAPPLAEVDPNSANNTAAPVSITVNAASDLSMVITPPPVVNAGQNCTFSAAITNAGPDAAASFTATFTVTGGTIVSAGSPVICTTSASTATCTGSSLAGGATVVVSVVATAGVSGSISLGATLTSPSDPNGANNAAGSGAVVISPTADMIAAQSGPASVLQGQNATVIVTISNVGPSASTNITLSDSFANGVLVSATPSQGTCSVSPTITCSLGTLASGASATVTIVLTATGVSPLTNSASVSAAEFDPASSNNTAAPLALAVNPVADLSVTQTGPASVYTGQNAVLTIVVKNNGPAGATNVILTDSLTGGTPISATTSKGSCSGLMTINCSIGALANGETAVINVTLYPGQIAIQSTATVSAAEADSSPSNNTSTLRIAATARADVSVSKSGPASASPGSTITYSITVSNAGPSTADDVYVTDATPAGLSPSSVSGACTALPCTLASLNSGDSATISASFTVASGGTAPAQITNTATATTKSDPNQANDSSSVTTSISCATAPPKLIAPVSGVVTSPVTFSWEPVANATTYEVFVVQDGKRSLGTTSATSLTGTIGTGAFSWYVVASTSDCGPLTSGNATLNACNRPDAPLASVVANAASGQSYAVEWASVIGASGYEIQEAGNSDFTGATAKTVTATSVMYSHTSATTSQPFFYRVRAIAACDPQLRGGWSIVIRVVIAPIPTQLVNPNANVPAGSIMVVIQDVPIPGIDDGHTYSFTASVDRPWMSVSPSSGILPPTGVILQISADPTSLTNGTFTGTLIVGISPVSGSLQTTGTTTFSVPISVNLVTPVTPTSATTTPANALVIPSVGHLDGINSRWQSDVRVANASSSKQQYLLTFTPTSNQAGIATTGVKQTTITIEGGSTVALDDVARNWFGIGSLGEAANGVLMIRSLDALRVTTPLVSSRTYSVSSSGTFGQYIPAIPFSSFINAAPEGALPAILSLQQVAQSDAFRTNLGLVEAGGKQATVTLSVFNAAGQNLRDIPLTIEPFQQLQLNSFLASNGIALGDGRIEVKVNGGGGKVTAYASVVDNKTSDPLLVSGVPLTQPLSSRYVLPGVADLDNGLASWRSDVRIFNAGTAPHPATFTLYPLGGGTPLTATLLLNPGQITLLDGAVKSLFGVGNVGGALHISTTASSNLIVTGRTYNAVTGGGTFGQFIPAVTAVDSVGRADRTLQILQVEDSARYRTNLGIAEVTGQSATAEISIHLPDSKATPIIEIPLNAYEYRQMPIIQQLGLGNVYNVRVSVKVTAGGGKVTAYGSVIDQQTQDPTYVPAQ